MATLQERAQTVCWNKLGESSEHFNQKYFPFRKGILQWKNKFLNTESVLDKKRTECKHANPNVTRNQLSPWYSPSHERCTDTDTGHKTVCIATSLFISSLVSDLLKCVRDFVFTLYMKNSHSFHSLS